ncbi:MAG: YitT family protein [Bacillota bacterium]|jgi:uncharacterized membrane-anchored protein YitT (DUF2179 family)
MTKKKVANIEKAVNIDKAEEQDNHKKHGLRKRLTRIIMIFIGAFIAGFALEICLLPNSVIDGGVVGVSMILSHVTGISLSIFLIIINIPFVYFGYKQIGKSFALYTLTGILCLSFWTAIFEKYDSFFHDTLLAAIFGGLILGVGIGLVMRNGGCMDGTEILAIVFSGRLPFSVGDIVMICNVFIFTAAGLILGWEQALYSMLAYFVVTKAIDIVLTGFNESKACFIITDRASEITDALLKRLGRGITVMEAEGGYSKDQKIVLYVIITKLEISKLKSIVEDIDPGAFVTISDVYEVMGGNFQKKSIH